MIVLGLVLLLLAYLTGVAALWTIGVLALVVGAVLLLVGGSGRAIGGRRYWW